MENTRLLLVGMNLVGFSGLCDTYMNMQELVHYYLKPQKPTGISTLVPVAVPYYQVIVY